MSTSTTETMTTSSAVTTSSLPRPPPSHLLEISIISAQNLAPISKSMRTYALTWVNPNRKLSTATDAEGNNNPTWNSKFAFPIDEEILDSDNSAVNIEIYTSSWFRYVIVGTVRVLISDLITPSARSNSNSKNIRFVALQVRRPSGSPQGILNMGVRLLDSSMRSMPLPTPIKHDEKNSDTIDGKNEEEEEKEKEENTLNEKVQLWRSLSTGSPVTPKQGSVCNGSMVNGSELCSDIGPSASIVAAELAMKSQPPPPPQPLKKLLRPAGQEDETGSSILEELTVEEARAKGYEYMSSRWRSVDNGVIGDEGESINRITRRKSDGEMFTCSLGNQFGIQFTISCGAPKHEEGNKKLIASESRSKMPSQTNSG